MAFMIVFTLVCSQLSLTSVEAKTIKITYKANGGTFKSGKKQVAVSRKSLKRGKAPTAKRSGYSLWGWYTKKSGGRKVSYKTKLKKSVKLYAHWVKKYKINKEYTTLISKTFLTLDELEKAIGPFQFIKDWDKYDHTATIKNSNGDIFEIKNNYAFEKPYEFNYIKTRAKNILNIKKDTSLEKFAKKMGLNLEYIYDDEDEERILTFKKGECKFRIAAHWIIANQENADFNIYWNVKYTKKKIVKPSSTVKLELKW